MTLGREIRVLQTTPHTSSSKGGYSRLPPSCVGQVLRGAARPLVSALMPVGQEGRRGGRCPVPQVHRFATEEVVHGRSGDGRVLHAPLVGLLQPVQRAQTVCDVVGVGRRHLSLGPQTPYSNLVVPIQLGAQWLQRALRWARDNDVDVFEATPESEDWWA